MEDTPFFNAEMEGLDFPTPPFAGISSPLSTLPSSPSTLTAPEHSFSPSRQNSMASEGTTHTTDSGDTVMMQGVPGGPPVSEWVFDDDIQNILDRHDAWVEKYDKQPSGPRLAEDEEIFCECNGFNDGTPMIKCDNGINCLKEWFHMRCVGIDEPGPEKGEEWYCRRCLYFERGSVLNFKRRMGLPSTAQILATEKAEADAVAKEIAEARRSKTEKLVKMPVTPKMKGKLNELDAMDSDKGKGAATTPDLLALTPDPASRTTLFVMSPLPTLTSKKASGKKKKAAPKASKLSTIYEPGTSVPLSDSSVPTPGSTSNAKSNQDLEAEPSSSANGPVLLRLESVPLGATTPANEQRAPYGPRSQPTFYKTDSWTWGEETALIGIMRQLLSDGSKGDKLFDAASEEMKKLGYNRVRNGIRAYWSRHLRVRNPELDERSVHKRGAGLQTSVQHRGIAHKGRKKVGGQAANGSDGVEVAIQSAPFECTVLPVTFETRLPDRARSI